MKYLLCFSLLVCVLIPVWSFNPALNARETFSTNFYRVIVPYLKKLTQNFVISPAAIQKLLILIYNYAEENVAESLLWDLFVKQVNLTRVHQDSAKTANPEKSYKALLQKEVDELKKQPIAREDVLKFFENDFTELNDKIMYENNLVVYNCPNHTADFEKFATKFFNTSIRHDGPSIKSDAPKDMAIFSFAALQTNWKIPFSEVNGTLTARGRFNIGVLPLRNCHVVELPLQADVPLTMMIFTPIKNDIREFFELLSHMGTDTLSDFNLVSKLLTDEEIEVKLPAFNISSSTNIYGFFEVDDLFRENVMLEKIFPNISKDGLNVHHFEQTSNFQLNAKGIGVADTLTAGRKEIKRTTPRKEEKGRTESTGLRKKDKIPITQTLEVTGKPFFFAIRSKKVLYFMGHYVGK